MFFINDKNPVSARMVVYLPDTPACLSLVQLYRWSQGRRTTAAGIQNSIYTGYSGYRDTIYRIQWMLGY